MKFENPIKSIINYFKKLFTVFGWKYILFQFCAFALIRGFLFKSIDTSLYTYFSSLNLSSNAIGRYFSIAHGFWTLQPVLGIVSDVYPLFGYHKRYYLLIFSFVGMLSLILLATIDFTAAKIGAPFLFFTVLSQVISINLLSKTKYIEMGNKFPEVKRHMLTFMISCQFVGKMCGNYVGYYINHYPISNVYWISLGFSFVIAIPLLLGYLPEEKIAPPKIDRQKIRDKKQMYLISLVIAVTTFAVTGVSTTDNSYALLATIVVVPAVVIFLTFWYLDLEMAKICLFVFIIYTFVVDVKSARSGFFLDRGSCTESPPDVGVSFLFTESQIYGDIISLIAPIVFQRFLKNVYITKIYILWFVIRMLGFVVEFLMVFRVNKLVGVSDKVFYVIGNEFLWNMSGTFKLLAAVMLMARRRDDDMICAFVSAFQSFGFGIARAFGNVLVDFLGIDFNSTPCKMGNYWVLILLAYGIFPLLVLPAILLLPKFKVTNDEGLEDSDDEMSSLISSKSIKITEDAKVENSV